MNSSVLLIVMFSLLISLYSVRSQDDQGSTSPSTSSNSTGTTTDGANATYPETTRPIENGTTGSTGTTQPDETPPPTTKPPVIPNLDPPNYRFKVLKSYHEDYITPSIFLIIGLIIIILTVAFHYYMDSKEKQKQVATGSPYIPDKTRREISSSGKSQSPTKLGEKPILSSKVN